MEAKTPRPQLYDVSVTPKVAEALFPSVCNWLEAGGFDLSDEATKAKIFHDLACALHARDGYRIARCLDDWDPDAELVAILAQGEKLYYETYCAMVEQWVRDNNLTPSYTLGEEVDVPINQTVLMHGHIAKVDAALLNYKVRCGTLVVMVDEEDLDMYNHANKIE